MKNIAGKVKIALVMLAVWLSVANVSRANNPPDEGMWLPLLLERLNYVDMQKMGLRLTPAELYNINNNSLKDAIVGLSGEGASGGFFCTAEMVSDQGLIFTNHHCGYSAIQNHSTPEHDYLADGFWAKTKEEELPNDPMCASFLERIEDVTDSIIPFLSDTLSESARSSKIREISNRLRKRAEEDGKFEVSVKSFYGGNEYYMFVFTTYKDVRLVGAPPSSIGKFGGDTDNWMWPRHTGDFSIFRVYTGPDGKPATYSKENIPLKPKHHLPISLKGIKKDDFAMIWGYPGSTSRYLTSYGIDYNLQVLYPTIIKLFGKQLEVMKERMDADRAVKIAYADDYAGIANTWKNFIGQSKMLVRNKVSDKKKVIENDFSAWVNARPERKEKYGNVLEELQKNYANMISQAKPYFYANIAGNGLEVVGLARQFSGLKSALEKKNKAEIEASKEGLREVVKESFKETDLLVSENTLAAMLKLYAQDVLKSDLPSIFTLIEKEFNNDFSAFAKTVYNTSVFATQERANNFINKPSLKVFKKDLGWMLMESMTEASGKNMAAMGSARTAVTAANRKFIAGIREMNPDLVKYPDANSTMRMTYGSVKDYYPADAVHYDYTTSIKGIMEKEDPTNDEFIVETRLKDLYKQKDYGRYGENGDLVVCFLTTNDITGGNSGSPVINADGHLIGIAFDGNWEAMSGDIMFEPQLQRTINVDIRYVLFVIDKFAGATNLIKELTIVK